MRTILIGATDKSAIIRFIDSTDGTPEQGIAYDTSGLTLWYRREGGTLQSITPVTLASLSAAHADGGFLHIDDGYCRVDVPDAAWASGATHVLIGASCTGMIAIAQEIQLVNYNPNDSVRAGLTALPNAAADAAGGIPISDAGGLDLDSKLAHTEEVTTARMGALTDWIDGGRLDLLLDSLLSRLTSARAGYLDLLNTYLDSAVSSRLSSAGYTAPDNTSIATILSRIIGTLESGSHNPQSGDAYSRLGAPAGASISADLADIPTVAEFEARTILAADYVQTSDLPSEPDNAGIAAAQAAAEAVDTRLPSDPADESLLEAAIATRAATGDAMTLTSGAVDAIHDEVVEGTTTLRQALRLLLSVLTGKVSGAPDGPIVFRDIGDTKDRITAEVDSDGNRTSVTRDAT